MTYMSKNAAIIKINLLQNSLARNYFETQERLFLKNMLDYLQKSNETELDEKIAVKISAIFQKYQKYT